MTNAGLRDTTAAIEQHGYHLATVNDWWDVLWNSGFRGPLSKLPPAELERFRQARLADVARTLTPEGIWLDNGIILTIGFAAPAA